MTPLQTVIRAANLWANGASNCAEIKEAIRRLEEQMREQDRKPEQGVLV